MKRVVALLGEDEVNRILEQEGKIEVGQHEQRLLCTIKACDTLACPLPVPSWHYPAPLCPGAGPLLASATCMICWLRLEMDHSWPASFLVMLVWAPRHVSGA